MKGLLVSYNFAIIAFFFFVKVFFILYIRFDRKDYFLTYSRVSAFQGRVHEQTGLGGENSYHFA